MGQFIGLRAKMTNKKERKLPQTEQEERTLTLENCNTETHFLKKKDSILNKISHLNQDSVNS